jgi:hypothetical protein
VIIDRPDEEDKSDPSRLTQTYLEQVNANKKCFCHRYVTSTWSRSWCVNPTDRPDMGQLSPDGKQFWITGRYHGEVAVIDTTK